MKRIIAIFIASLLMLSTVSASAGVQDSILVQMTMQGIPSPEEPAEEANVPAHSAVVGVNTDAAIIDGYELKLSPAVIAYGRTYVDVYALAPFFDTAINWVDANTFATVLGNKKVLWTRLTRYPKLQSQNNIFFVKDDILYVSAREFADFLGLGIYYDRGIITIGEALVPDTFALPDTSVTYEEYIQNAYPDIKEYVVNPYKPYSYETMLSDAERLADMYPDLISTSVIGKSVENRDLLLVEFGKGPNKIFICGTHHAREYMATAYIMYAVDRYSYAYSQNSMWGRYNPRDILDNVTFCIVPMVNPDGVNLVQNGVYATQNPQELLQMGIYESPEHGFRAWKANIRGVDVNWNYDKDWFLKRNKNERGSTGFNGYAPATEPETVAIQRYVDSTPFDAYISFHTQGQVIYWADSVSNPVYLQNAIKNDTGFTPYRSGDDEMGGSFFDYVYRKYDKPTITVELCPYVGNYPYPEWDFNTVWKPAKNILLVIGNEIIYNKIKNMR